jgi:non-heme chloroperoxidase
VAWWKKAAAKCATAAIADYLGVQGAVHVDHSTGSGEVIHYIARHGEGRVCKAAVIGVAPPLIV